MRLGLASAVGYANVERVDVEDTLPSGVTKAHGELAILDATHDERLDPVNPRIVGYQTGLERRGATTDP